MNIEAARENMIKQQLRANAVLNPQLLDLLSTIPREHFVPAAYRHMAFADMQIPIGHQQVMMTPTQEGQLLQALDISTTDDILEIGTGTGYLTSLLATLGKHVVTVDCYQAFVEHAREKLTAYKLSNIDYGVGDAASGWLEQAPYDVIAITGALPFLPNEFRLQLKPGGRIFAILGEGPVMHAVMIKNQPDSDKWQKTILFDTSIPLLLNAKQRDAFVF